MYFERNLNTWANVAKIGLNYMEAKRRNDINNESNTFAMKSVESLTVQELNDYEPTKARILGDLQNHLKETIPFIQPNELSNAENIISDYLDKDIQYVKSNLGEVAKNEFLAVQTDVLDNVGKGNMTFDEAKNFINISAKDLSNFTQEHDSLKSKALLELHDFMLLNSESPEDIRSVVDSANDELHARDAQKLRLKGEKMLKMNLAEELSPVDLTIKKDNIVSGLGYNGKKSSLLTQASDLIQENINKNADVIDILADKEENPFLKEVLIERSAFIRKNIATDSATFLESQGIILSRDIDFSDTRSVLSSMENSLKNFEATSEVYGNASTFFSRKNIKQLIEYSKNASPEQNDSLMKALSTLEKLNPDASLALMRQLPMDLKGLYALNTMLPEFDFSNSYRDYKLFTKKDTPKQIKIADDIYNSFAYTDGENNTSIADSVISFLEKTDESGLIQKKLKTLNHGHYFGDNLIFSNKVAENKIINMEKIIQDKSLPKIQKDSYIDKINKLKNSTKDMINSIFARETKNGIEITPENLVKSFGIENIQESLNKKIYILAGNEKFLAKNIIMDNLSLVNETTNSYYLYFEGEASRSFLVDKDGKPIILSKKDFLRFKIGR